MMKLKSWSHAIVEMLFAVRRGIEGATPEARLVLFRFLAKGYCTACGEAAITTCHCENDE